MTLLPLLLEETWRSVRDLLPIVVLFAGFQFIILREPLAHPRRIAAGLLLTALGLTLFRIGLEASLIPSGRDMARQLVRPGAADAPPPLIPNLPLFAFAALVAFTAAFIEPTLIAAGRQVQDLSGGALKALTLRLVVAAGVALGLMLGTARILYGIRIEWLILVLVAALTLLARFAPRDIVPLALDTGGMATSVVTVPLIAAFGLAIAESVPGRDPMTDGFGLILLALLLPPVTLLAFATLSRLLRRQSG